MRPIRSQADLDRANILVAWSLAETMRPAEFNELCRVTVRQMQRDLAEDLTVEDDEAHHG